MGQSSSAVRSRAFLGDVRRRLHVVAAPFLAGKLATLAVIVLTVAARSQTPGFPRLAELGDAFAFWDGQAYLDIAAHGYPAGPLDLVPGHPGHLWAYLFGYPLLVRIAQTIVGNPVLAGVLLSAVGELLALLFLHELVRQERDDESAGFAAWMLAVFPYAVFLSLVYTESLFIAAASAALVFARRRRHGAACIAGACAMALRITGVALLPALAIEVLASRRGRGRIGGLVAVATVAAPFAGFCLYAWHLTGDPLAYFHAEGSASYGNRHLAWPWQGALATFHLATGQTPSSYNSLWAIEVLAGTLGALTVAALWLSPRIPPSFASYATVVYLLPVCLTYWISLPRYAIAILPGFLLLADLTARHPHWRIGLVATSAALMGYATSVFASGRFLA